MHNVADLVQIVLLGLAELLTAASHSTDESAMSHSFFCLTELGLRFQRKRAKGKLLIDGLQRFMSNLKLRNLNLNSANEMLPLVFN